MKWLTLLALSATAGCVRDLSTDNFNRPFDPWVPSDVRAFVIDAQACTHFSGEAGYDPERAAFLQRMIRKTCTNIDNRAKRLRHRYSSPEVRQLIADTWQ